MDKLFEIIGIREYIPWLANASQLNNITIDDGARSAIQQALVQGLEVTVHQNPINVNGWQGSGYSVLDPETGVGAYQISGGASGGALENLAAFSDAMSWASISFSIWHTILGLLGSPYGFVVASVSGYVNLFTGIMAWSLACGDAAANMLFYMLSTFMFVIATLLATGAFGIIGIIFSLLISSVMQYAALQLSTFISTSCRKQ